MSRIYQIFYVSLLLILTACGTSPANNFYVLTANSSSYAKEIPETHQSGPAVGVGPVSIPEFLQRSQIAYSLQNNNLILSQFDRWSEPLDTAIIRVLGLNLSQLDPERPVIPFPWRQSSKPTRSVQVTVLELNRSASDQARLIADWHLVDLESKQNIYNGRFAQSAYISEFSYSNLVKAYSDLLADMSTSISTELQKH